MLPDNNGSVLLWSSLKPLTYAVTLVIIASLLQEVINLLSIVKSKGLPLRILLNKSTIFSCKIIKLCLWKSLITSSTLACLMQDRWSVKQSALKSLINV